MKTYEQLTEEEKRAACEKAMRLMESPTWPYVLIFAERMETKLEKNRHKGNREGWLGDHPWNLVERLLEETVEVQECFQNHSMLGVILRKSPEETADECADVANFCMMVADCCLEHSRRKSEASNDQAHPLGADNHKNL